MYYAFYGILQGTSGITYTGMWQIGDSTLLHGRIPCTQQLRKLTSIELMQRCRDMLVDLRITEWQHLETTAFSNHLSLPLQSKLYLWHCYDTVIYSILDDTSQFKNAEQILYCNTTLQKLFVSLDMKPSLNWLCCALFCCINYSSTVQVPSGVARIFSGEKERDYIMKDFKKSLTGTV